MRDQVVYGESFGLFEIVSEIGKQPENNIYMIWYTFIEQFALKIYWKLQTASTKKSIELLKRLESGFPFWKKSSAKYSSFYITRNKCCTVLCSNDCDALNGHRHFMSVQLDKANCLIKLKLCIVTFEHCQKQNFLQQNVIVSAVSRPGSLVNN